MLTAMQPDLIRAAADGRLEELAAAGDDFISRGAELGSGLAACTSSSVSVRGKLLLGRTDEVLQSLDDSGGMTGVQRDSEVGNRRVQRSRFLAQAGRHADKRPLLAAAVAGLRAGGEPVASVSTLFSLMETALILEDRQIVSFLEKLLAGEEANAEVWPTGWSVPGRVLGGAAALLGRPEAARDYYMQALEAMARIHFPPEIALTRLWLAELLLAYYPDEAAEAQQHLDFAIEEFRAMQMQPSLERALRHKGMRKA